MSDPRSALGGAVYQGYVTVEDAGAHGMLTLRGDHAELADAVKAAVGQGVPAQRRIEGGLGGGAAWASPDELLLFCEYTQSGEALQAVRKALAGKHFLAADVSDARAVFTLEGPGIRDLLAKLCPANLSPEALPHGEFRRSHIGQVAAAFWLENESRATVVCFRSVAGYMFDLLSKAAEPGSELGYFAPTSS
ncbi:sarcosine oxidase subunit gamma [Oceanicola sp. D3]|uniref:sarcosine oxidase subunit gamma n=1 Tax=Oceanicola sp. D3 TaxID=2587163 RepID=UPI001123DDA2|nr:sarcosine oxidase subunit gamma family protein [Oceanicola sp. D3]QDC09201.1 sarcosine oxidase subunit gamma [Oceanicola sp. D3]